MTQQHHALELSGVGVTIDKTRIIDGVSWRVPRGCTAALLGPNGSGKSTLLRMITGYLFPTNGTAEVLGQRLGAVDLHQLRQSIGRVDPQGPVGPDEQMTVLEVVTTGFFGHFCIFFDEPTAEQQARAMQALAEVGLSSHHRQRYGTLSTGEQRRTLLARALVHRPELLVLDEPTAGLDLRARETVLATVDSLARRFPQMTTLMVTHHLEELLPRTDQVLLLSGGRVAADGPPDTVLTAENLHHAFGCPVRVTRTNGRWVWTVEPEVWQTLLR